MGPRAPFAIEEHRDDGQVRLKLTGELDMGSAGSLEAALAKLQANGMPVQLDLSELEFMDSTGLHVIINATQESQRDGWSFAIQPGVSRQVQRLFRLTGLEDVLA